MENFSLRRAAPPYPNIAASMRRVALSLTGLLLPGLLVLAGGGHSEAPASRRLTVQSRPQPRLPATIATVNGAEGGFQCNEGGAGTAGGGNPSIVVAVGEKLLSGTNTRNSCAGLLRFPLAGLLPAGARITQATVKLHTANKFGTMFSLEVHGYDVSAGTALPFGAYNNSTWNDLTAMTASRPDYGTTYASLYAFGPVDSFMTLNSSALDDLQNRIRAGGLDSFTLGLYALGSPAPTPGNYLELDSALSTLQIDYIPGAADGVAIQSVRIDKTASGIPARIRLFNYGPDADLAGWSLSGNYGYAFAAALPQPLPRQRALTIIDSAGTNTAGTIYTGGGLFNYGIGGGMSLLLVRSDGTQTDFVCWGGLTPAGSNAWNDGCSGAPVPGGYYLRDRDADTDGAGDWRVSAADDGRTTGVRRPAQLAFNEIRAASGENWIELLNPGPMVNLRGWSVEVYTTGNTVPDGTYTFPADNPLPSGTVLWLAGNFYFGLAGNPVADNQHRNLSFNPAWSAANPGGELRLLDPAGIVRDEAFFGPVQPRKASQNYFWSGPPIPTAGYPFTLQRRTDLSTRSAVGWVSVADGSNFGARSPGQLGNGIHHDAAGSLAKMSSLAGGAYGAGTVFTVARRSFVSELAIAGAPLAAPLTGVLVVKQLGGGILFSAPVSAAQEGLQIFRADLSASPLSLGPGQYAVMLYLNGPWAASYDDPAISGAAELLSFGTVDGFTLEAGGSPTPGFTVQTGKIPALWLASLAPPEILSSPALPDTEATAPYSVTLSAVGNGALSWSLAAGVLPPGLSLTSGGILNGPLTLAGDFSFTLRVSDSQGLYADQLFSLHVAPGPNIVTSGLPVYDSLNMNSYSVTLGGEDGTPLYTWSCGFPLALNNFMCDSNGVLHSTAPTTAPDGTYAITLNLTDAVGGIASRVVSMQVYTTPVILTTSLADGFIGISYGIQHLLAAGGSGAGVWSIDAATPLPGGLSLSGADITGTPSTTDTEGDYPVRLQYSNNGGAAAARLLTITIRTATAPPYWVRRGLTGGELADLSFSPAFSLDRTVVAVAANRQSVYVAQDGGFFWKLLPLDLPDIFFVEYQIHDTIHNVTFPAGFDGRTGQGNKTIVIAADSGLWRSQDLGQTWAMISMIPAGFHCEATLWFDPTLPTTAYCTGKSGGDLDPYVYRSDDDLATWTKFSVQPVSKIFLSPTFAADQTMFGLFINENIKRSDDGGRTWKQLSFFGGGTRGQRLEISPNYVNDGTVAFIGMYTQAIYLSTNGGVYFSQTAGSYRPRAVRFPADYNAVTHPWIYASGEGTDTPQNGCQMMVSRDNGFTLSPTGTGGMPPSNFSQFDCPFFLPPDFATDGNILVLGAKGSALYRSQDRGELWGPSDSGVFLQAINSVAFAPDFAVSKRMFLATSQGLFYSPNGGRVWKAGQFDAPLPAEMTVTAIAVAPNYDSNLNKKLFAYACPADYSVGCKIIRSVDGGVHWTQRGTVGNYAFFDPYSLAVSPHYAVDGKLYVAFYDNTDSRLFSSSDDGSTFTAVLPSTLDSASKFALSPGFATDGRLLVSNYGKYPAPPVNYKVFGGGVSASPLAFPTGNYAPAYASDFVDDGVAGKDGTSARHHQRSAAADRLRTDHPLPRLFH